MGRYIYKANASNLIILRIMLYFDIIRSLLSKIGRFWVRNFDFRYIGGWVPKRNYLLNVLRDLYIKFQM